MIKKITAYNFFSWEKLEFEVQKGITLIDGMNHDEGSAEGAGKSAILNALMWGIYGKLPKDLNVDDVIRYGQKKCEVTVEFEGGVSVTRTRKPNDLFLTQNGEAQRGADAKATQKLIVDFVGLSYEASIQICYQSQNNQSKFLKANQEEKAKILSEIIELNVYDKARKNVLEEIKDSESLELDLRHKGQLIGKDLDSLSKDFDREMEKQRARIKTHEKEGEYLQREIQTLTTQASEKSKIFDLAKDTHDKEIAELEVTLKEMRVVGEELGLEQETLTKLLQEKVEAGLLQEDQRLKIHEEIATLKATISQHKDRQLFHQQQTIARKQVAQRYKKNEEDKVVLEQFIENPQKDCPACGTLLKECDVSHALKEVKRLKLEMLSQIKVVEDISELLKEELPDISTLTRKIGELQALIQADSPKQVEYKNVEKEISEKQGKAIGIQNALDNMKSMLLNKMNNPPQEDVTATLDVEAKLNGKRDELKEHNSVVFDPQSDAALKVVEDIVKMKRKDESCREELVAAARNLVILGELKTSFRAIKSYVFEGVLQEINHKVSTFLEDLFEIECEVSFQNEAGKVMTRVGLGGEEIRLGNLSGGQFRRVALAVDLALQEVLEGRKNSKLGICILDEYFKDLSETSMEKCLELLKRLERPVLLIEHNSIFKSIVQNVFWMEKRGGVSHAIKSV